MRKPEVLLVGCDSEDRAFVRQALGRVQCATVTVRGASNALDRLRDIPFDVVIMPLELDDRLSGLRLARAVRWRWPETSVIMLTESESFDTVRAALELGVDACLLKPVDEAHLQEVVRQAIEGRQGGESVEEMPAVLKWRRLALYRHEGKVTVDGEGIHLTPTEFKLLCHLMENGHRVVSSEELFEIAHGHPPRDPARADDAIRWHIHNLRRKIEPDPRTPVYIFNVYGLGYTFAGVEK
jgi:DNA-binding response OmpR family regulator